MAFSDGVTDTVGADGRFGEERLLAALRDAGSAADAVARIDAALNAFQRPGQADDTAVLALDIPTLDLILANRKDARLEGCQGPTLGVEMGMRKRVVAGLCMSLAVAATAPAVAGAQARSDVWDAVAGSLPATRRFTG